MNQEIKNIKLKFECPANWDAMPAVNGGRFCNQCHKVVYDFTDAKVQTFLDLLAENNGHICGRYRLGQLAATHPVIPAWKKWLSAAMLIVGINLLHSKAAAQTEADMNKVVNPPKKQVDETAVFGMAIEVEPTYIGNLPKFLHDNIRYTSDMKAGKVFASFVVGADGSVSDIRIIRGLGKPNDDEVVRVLSLTKWRPGIQNGKPMRSMYTVPVLFPVPAPAN